MKRCKRFRYSLCSRSATVQPIQSLHKRCFKICSFSLGSDFFLFIDFLCGFHYSTNWNWPLHLFLSGLFLCGLFLSGLFLCGLSGPQHFLLSGLMDICEVQFSIRRPSCKIAQHRAWDETGTRGTRGCRWRRRRWTDRYKGVKHTSWLRIFYLLALLLSLLVQLLVDLLIYLVFFWSNFLLLFLLLLTGYIPDGGQETLFFLLFFLLLASFFFTDGHIQSVSNLNPPTVEFPGLQRRVLALDMRDKCLFHLVGSWSRETSRDPQEGTAPSLLGTRLMHIPVGSLWSKAPLRSSFL